MKKVREFLMPSICLVLMFALCSVTNLFFVNAQGGIGSGQVSRQQIVIQPNTPIVTALNYGFATNINNRNEKVLLTVLEPEELAGATILATASVVESAGRTFKGAKLYLSFNSVSFPDGSEYPIVGQVSKIELPPNSQNKKFKYKLDEEGAILAPSDFKKDFWTILGFAALGVAAGAAADGTRGITKVAPITTATGVAVAGATKSPDIVLPSNTEITLIISGRGTPSRNSDSGFGTVIVQPKKLTIENKAPMTEDDNPPVFKGTGAGVSNKRRSFDTEKLTIENKAPMVQDDNPPVFRKSRNSEKKKLAAKK